MRLVSMELAERIWIAHREIRAAEKLKQGIEKEIADGGGPTPIDVLRLRQTLRISVPSGDHARFFTVTPAVAIKVLDEHVETMRQKLEAACTEVFADAAPQSPEEISR